MSTRRPQRYVLVAVDDDEDDDDAFVPERIRNALTLADEGLNFEQIGGLLGESAEVVRTWCEDFWTEQAAQTLLN